MWNGLKVSGAGTGWAGGAGAGAVLIGWGGSTGGCVLDGLGEGKREKLDGGL